ncbi:hypothetical protein DACRYDRAFT_113417 [Dacryopinax primogenitus]|uniref:Uncharacterized protein n=1 Tax=Dacryopinax primogenitus (strain DJM 731) TaxID=1858805 RepID=M5GGC4_DACPD|nr:uncharacterized protein DACRYDRAFT_113417 [Dacryopinax primogenitus]EJU05243.1 hypothetical protein DACRYDRAFT_113417 [Dacryopinax primogenitus]
MASAIALVGANSPLLAYWPFVGVDPTEEWMLTYAPFTWPPIPVCYTEAPGTNIQFDFYGSEFQLLGPEEQGCGYTLLINGTDSGKNGFAEPVQLPAGQYHIEVNLSYSAGEFFNFEGFAFKSTEENSTLKDITTFINAPNIRPTGQWEETTLYSEFYHANFTQYLTNSTGAQLEYNFQGIQTTIMGSVGPSAGPFRVTIDGQSEVPLSAYRPVADDLVTLYVKQLPFADNSGSHNVIVTNLGQTNTVTILAISYDQLVSST